MKIVLIVALFALPRPEMMTADDAQVPIARTTYDAFGRPAEKVPCCGYLGFVPMHEHKLHHSVRAETAMRRESLDRNVRWKDWWESRLLGVSISNELSRVCDALLKPFYPRSYFWKSHPRR